MAQRKSLIELRRMRQGANLTQVGLAELTGINEATVCLAERGRVNLTDDEYARMEKALRKALVERSAELAKFAASAAAEEMATP